MTATISRTGIAYAVTPTRPEIACAWCGRMFTPYLANTQRHCSAKCRERTRLHAESAARAATRQQRTCDYCGAPFLTNKAKQRWCSSKCAKPGYKAEKRGTLKRTPKPPTGQTVHCQTCGEPFTRTIKRRVYCSDDCRLHGIATTPDVQVAVLRTNETRYSKGTFTDAEFEAAYQEIRRELQAQGKPLYQMTAEQAREKSRREVMRGE